MLIEADQQLKDMGVPNATHTIASVGVGSWAQAVTTHYKAKSSPAAVVTVEPDSAASLKASLEAGKITPITTGETIMNGMNCGGSHILFTHIEYVDLTCLGTTSTTAWRILNKGVDASVTVSDSSVHNDVQYLHRQGIRVGPCGAAPLSALRKLCQEKRAELNLDERSAIVLFSTEGARGYVDPTQV